MKLSREELRGMGGQVVWMCSYTPRPDYMNIVKKHEPIQVKLADKATVRCFYHHLKPDGTPYPAKNCGSYAHFFDNRSDCIIYYNELVDNAVKRQEQIMKAHKDNKV